MEDVGDGGGADEESTAPADGQSSPVANDPSIELDVFLQDHESGGNHGSSFCDVDSKQISKQRVPTEFLGPHFGSASRDRLKRARGPTAGTPRAAGVPGVGGGDTESTGIGNTDARELDVGDPFAMMVSVGPGRFTLSLFLTKSPAPTSTRFRFTKTCDSC